MQKYRKKPVEVYAVQWTGFNRDEMKTFASSLFDPMFKGVEYSARVYDGLHSTWVLVKTGDYIIKGIQGEFYPCREDVFLETYEPV